MRKFPGSLVGPFLCSNLSTLCDQEGGGDPRTFTLLINFSKISNFKLFLNKKTEEKTGRIDLISKTKIFWFQVSVTLFLRRRLKNDLIWAYLNDLIVRNGFGLHKLFMQWIHWLVFGILFTFAVFLDPYLKTTKNYSRTK